jgi:alpha/beta superfamily hydrolase
VSESNAFYLDLRGEPVLALYDPPATDPAGTAVLICPPWGWDEVASYRSRRTWAESLAAAGHPTLRIDLPGTGDSGGGPGSGGLLDRWVEAVGLAAGWLRAEAGEAGLALLGIGLGGLLAAEALDRGLLVEELVVWGAPADGRHFVREARAFAAMQAGRPADAGALPGALPEGWIESGGFVLSGDTLAALKRLSPTGLPASRRVLLLGRDGVADTAGADRLAAAGAEVTEDPGEGWGEFVAHPETTVLPAAVEGVVRGWLGRRPVALDAADREGPEAPTAPRVTFGAGPGAFSEEPVRVPGSFGDAFGILARPLDPPSEPPHCAVFLNAGAVRHIGPNRLWTEAARALGASGVPSLRVDLESIGEADGDPARRATIGDFYDPAFVGQVVSVLDWLEREGVARSFRLVGLCAGAYWAFRAGLGDERIETEVLLNSGALSWHPGILEEREGRRFGRLLQRRWWGMLVRREIKPSSVLRLVRLVPTALGRLARRLVGRGEASGGSRIELDLDSLPPERRVAIAFSGSEPLREELEALGILDRLAAWPGLCLSELPGADHTLRSTVSQRAARVLIECEAGPGEPRRST